MLDRTAARKSPDLADELRFLGSWISKPLVTGAFSPSGKQLARTMARFVDPSLPGTVVELGPGTGAVTRALLERGLAPERLVVIEFNPGFCKLLRKRFPGVRVVQGDAYAASTVLGDTVADGAMAVVSSLPLLTKPVEERSALLADCFGFMRPGAPFIQFTYGGEPPIPTVAGHARVKATPRIWLNLPPAKVYAYRQPLAVAA